MHNQDALIEKKLDGTLTQEETQQFDHLLRADPAFAHAYTTQKEMIALFRQHQRETLQEELEAGYQQYQKKRTLRSYYYGAAAVVVLLVAFGIWFWLPAHHEQLFAAYYRPYEATIARGITHEQQQKAVMLYSQGAYTIAIPLLRSLQQTEKDANYWTLLLGNAYLQVDSTAQAIKQFEQVAVSGHTDYQQYSQWYTAMTYLKEDDTTTARAMLQSIAEYPGLFQHKAQLLLNDL